MFLKCIEMTGFKSFPEKTVMHMNGSITGVVGPNGSGKSNVSDAVRWVLGEQSPKTLRGSVMQDVIFAGTQKRKPRSFCEVSLIFDNSDNRISSTYSEIQVTRKLYNSGESEYYLNNIKCRLKDILSMFRDTGIGKEGYSIIGQGRIDEILSERSLDRRRIFEEASGIMKYRVRKEEAERKLEKTRFNLVRIEDILQEQKLRLDPLKIQADEAMSYLKLSDRLRHLEVNLFLHSYDSGNDRIEKLKLTKKALLEEKDQKEKQLRDFGKLLLSDQENAKGLEEKRAELSNSLSLSLAEIEHVEGEINLCDERIANTEKDSERLEHELKEEGEKVAALTEDGNKNNLRISMIGREIEGLRETIKSIDDDLLALTSEFDDRVRIIETVQNDKLSAIEKISDIKSVTSGLKEKESYMLQKLDETDERLTAAEKQKAEFEVLLTRLKEELDLSEKRSSEIKDSYNEKIYTKNSESAEIAEIRKQIETAKREHTACVSSVRMLHDMQNSFEGYLGSVRKLLLAAKNDPIIRTHMIGTFASLISVPQKYETAVESCLGAALQDVVVNDEYDAKYLISYLRKNDLGRVTFLPLKALKPKSLSEVERKLLESDGVCGVASELISCSKDIKKALESLLGRTVFVEDNDTAIRIMRENHYTFRAVTLEGDVFNPGGAITGGSMRNERTYLVSRDRRVEEIKKKEADLSEKIESLETVLNLKQKELDDIMEQIESARRDLHTNELKISADREKFDTLTISSDDIEKSISALNTQKVNLSNDLEAVRNKIAKYDSIRSDIQQASDTKNEDYKRMEEDYNKKSAAIEEKKKIMHDAEIKEAELYKENNAVLNDNIRLKKEKQELEGSIAIKNKTLELNSESKGNLLKLKGELELLYQQKKLISEEIRSKQDNIIESRADLERALSERDENISALRQELSDISEKVLRCDFNTEKTETGIVDIQNKLWDSYHLTYANALPFKEKIIISETQAESEEVKQKIRDMGSVNPNAIEDYNELKERMQSLAAQKDDLINAEGDLHKIIASLLDEMKKTFKTSFEQINRYFNQTFQELFDGGSARLILEDEQDIMECGIEIVAEPPGKRLQKISLLSGGEKALTAISLLFALLKINPSPVCILDEIDAALDDANVYKFSEYLQKYARKMQFIVITHKKPTMAICDSLYGFAMEEKGVSKLLSVRLD